MLNMNKEIYNLREACVKAIQKKYGDVRELIMDKISGSTYGAVFWGEGDITYVEIPNCRHYPLNIYMNRGWFRDEEDA